MVEMWMYTFKVISKYAKYLICLYICHLLWNSLTSGLLPFTIEGMLPWPPFTKSDLGVTEYKLLLSLYISLPKLFYCCCYCCCCCCCCCYCCCFVTYIHHIPGKQRQLLLDSWTFLKTLCHYLRFILFFQWVFIPQNCDN